jgi:hypothetical protein
MNVFNSPKEKKNVLVRRKVESFEIGGKLNLMKELKN